MSGALKRAKTGPRGFRPAVGIVEGDPGLFGGIVGAVKGGFTSLFTGGNPIAGAARGAISGSRGRAAAAPVFPAMVATTRSSLPAFPQMGSPRSFPVGPTPGVVGAIQRFLPGGSTGTEVTIPSPGLMPTPMLTPKGFHPNKTSYFLTDGTFVAKGSRFVKNRRRNPLNPRALRSAIGRIDAGKIWQGKLAEISTGKFTAAGKRKD